METLNKSCLPLWRLFQRVRSSKKQSSAPTETSPTKVEPGNDNGQQQVLAASSTATLNFSLENRTNSNTVFAYITGRALDNNGALFLLRSDGKTPYYPESPTSIGANLG